MQLEDISLEDNKWMAIPLQIKKNDHLHEVTRVLIGNNRHRVIIEKFDGYFK